MISPSYWIGGSENIEKILASNADITVTEPDFFYSIIKKLSDFEILSIFHENFFNRW